MSALSGGKSSRKSVPEARRVAREAQALARQQAAVAQLGQLALTGGDLSALMREASAMVARTLRVEYSKILELLPGAQEFLLRAGVGWKRGYVSRARVGTERGSQAGYTLLSARPVVTEDLRKETRFRAPRLLVEHNVRSGISVVILGRKHHFGIFGAHSIQTRRFSNNDINFVQAVANVLATAIERKKAEEVLNHQTQVLDQIHDAVVATDVNGVVTNWNQGATRLFGYSSQEALGQHVSLVYRSDRHEFLERQVIAPLKENGVHEIEVEMQKKSGQAFSAHLSLSLLRNSRDEVVGMIGYSMDITARKKAEANLHALNAALQREIAEHKAAQLLADGHTQITLRTLDTLTKEADLEKVLDEVLVVLTEELQAHSSALWFHDFTSGLNTLQKTAFAGRILSGDQQLDFPYAGKAIQIGAGIAAKSLDREPFAVEQVPKSCLLDPEIREWMIRHRVKTLLCVPLLFGNKVIGTLAIRESRRERFSQEDLRLALTLASHVSLAVNLMRMAKDAERAAIFQERNRVARDMHDTLGQGFAGIVLLLEVAEDFIAGNQRLALKHLRRARELARDSLAEARRSLWALRPNCLQDADLVTALRHLAQQMTIGKQVKVQFSVRGALTPLSPETELHLLRIAQESLTNAIKHGRANLIRLTLDSSAERIQLCVQDNGSGLKKNRSASVGGLGHASLRERAKQIGATVNVRSKPGLGTRVSVRIPFAHPFTTDPAI